MNRFMFLCVALLAPAFCLAADDNPNELTGVFHKAVSKNPAYLEIDGAGFNSRVIVTGEELNSIPNKTRVWITGKIKTSLYGSPDQAQQDDQAAPTQWFIVFHVEKCVRIDEPFQRPKAKTLQNKQVEATR